MNTSNQGLIRRSFSYAVATGRAVLDRAAATQFAGLRAGHYQIVLSPAETRDLQHSSTDRGAATPSKLKLAPASRKLASVGTELLHNEHCDIAEFGSVRIDFMRHEAWRAGLPVSLTAFEFRVLRFFIANPCRVVSRNELLETVWGYNCYPTTRTVDNKILRLRQNLETDPANPVHFLTVHGAGYKFAP